MGKIESVHINGMCVKSATKLMEQLNIYQKDVPDVKISEIKNIYPFGNDKSGMFIAAEDKSSSVLIYKIDDAAGNLSVMSSRLSGHNAVAGFDKDNKICVFAINGDSVLYTEETAPSKCEFSKPKEIKITRPAYDGIIDKLIIHSLNDDSRFPFVLAVVFKCGAKYWIDLIYWGLSEDIFFKYPLTSQCFMFNGSTRQTLKLEVLGENHVVYDMYKNELVSWRQVDWHGEKAEGLSLKEAAGSSFVFHQSGYNKKISVLVSDSHTKEICVKTLFSDSNLQCFDVWKDKNGVSFSVHTDVICHGAAQLSPDGEWNAGTLVPLAADSSMLRTLYHNGAMHLFYLDISEESLCKLEDMDGEDWNETKYKAVGQDSVVPRACYSTEVTITDKIHKTKPLSGVEIKLFAESRAYVETSEGTAVIDEANYITLHTNAQGKLFFRQYCSRLDVPVLNMKFNVSDNMCGDESVITFSQFSDIKNTLSNIDGETLLNAQEIDSKTGITSPLIDYKFRTADNADNIANSIRSLFKQFDKGASTVMSIKAANKFDPGITEAGETFSWSLKFLGDGKTVYEELSSDVAEEKIQFLKCEAMGVPKWMTRIGDFFRAVAKSVVNVCEVIVTGAKAVFTFIINNVKMIFETVISAVKDILKIVEIILKPVSVMFEDIFHWLASLFGWNYVLYTKRAIANTIEFFMDLMPEKAEESFDELRRKIEESQSKIDDWLDNIMQNINPDSKCMDIIEQCIPDELPYAYELSNDPLQAKLSQMEYPKEIPVPLSEDIGINESIQKVINKLNNFAELRNSKDFSKAEEYFKKSFNNTDNFYSFMLKGLLSAIRGILHAILDGCVEVISALISAFGEIMSALKKVLTKPIDLPLFNEIYSWLSGGDMSLLDVSSLIMALPVTIAGKCFLGRVPFSSEEEADAFVEDIRRRFSGKNESDVFSNAETKLSSNNQKILKIIMTMSAHTSVSFNSYSDVLLIAGPETAKAGNVFSMMSLTAEVLWFHMASPELYMTADEAGYDFAMDLWRFFQVGACMDVGLTYMCGTKRLDESVARIMKCIYGIGHVVFASVGMYSKSIPEYAFVAEFGAAVIEILGVLFLIKEKKILMAAVVVEFAAIYTILVSNIFWCNDNHNNIYISGSWNDHCRHDLI